jgi:hypothetical protein
MSLASSKQLSLFSSAPSASSAVELLHNRKDAEDPEDEKEIRKSGRAPRV